MIGMDTLYDDGVLQISRTISPPGLAFAGEIDDSTYPALVKALEAVVGQPGDIHLDLSAVRYCDLAGLRAIVCVAETRAKGSGDTGERVVLRALPPQLRTVLRIVGWDSIAGLVLGEV
jgi:anti-anti-sigma factor